MSQTFDTPQWLAFFTKAGLPPNVAANYALIFSDNRIQLDMLMDLSKEYLYDMGIRVMGDVIAILRFAKEFHTQMAKERAIGNPVLPNKVVGRMVGHYTRPLRSSPKPQLLRSSQDVPKAAQLNPKKSTIISLKRATCNEVPIKKIRRVSPEEEGAYKIKMPLGITEKTRKILQQQQAVQSSKRSVFARLGDSSVSSSTDATKSSSVFERLGPSNKTSSDDTPTSTVLGETIKAKRLGPPLQYQGVLKITRNSTNKRVISSGSSSRTVIKPSSLRINTNAKVVSLNRINNILQSNSHLRKNTINKSQGILSRNTNPTKVGIRSRLGVKFDSRNLARTKILLNASKGLSAKKTSNVFDRLGK